MNASPGSALPQNYAAVLEAVERSGPGRHLSAQDVWSLARAARPRLGFATVHRALIRLADRGLIQKIDVPGAPMAYYEPAAAPHAHFRCSDCGDIQDVPFTLSAGTLSEIAAAHDLTIAGATLAFNGRCAACRA